MNADNIIQALYEGVVTIVFEKVGTGEIRTMPCTLNNDISKQKMTIGKYTSPDSIVCYGLDVDAWRDVRVNTIKEWYKGYPTNVE